MSSHAPSPETGDSDTATAAGIATTSSERTRFHVERQILCTRIAELERELERERRHRIQILDRYERLLERDREQEGNGRRENEPERSGLLGRLF